MDHHGGKIAAGLLCLVIVWIIVFWLWTPTEAKISFSTAEAGNSERLAGDQGARTKPEPSEPTPTLPKKPEPTPEPKPVAKRDTGGGVVAPEFMDYSVQPGDTFASIALKFFGSRGKADVIANANPLVDPTRIRAGRVLRIPRDPANIQGKPTVRPPTTGEASPGSSRTHTVVRGDTLSGISQKYYGTIKRVDLILQSNRSVLSRAEDLRPGQVLKIPPAPQ